MPVFARDNKLGGYVLDAAAFRKIHSYCVDTHNLPLREVMLIDGFVLRESKPNGLLARLPWRRFATCQEGGHDAIVRLEFPSDSFPSVFVSRSVNGMLFVFSPNSPSPVYETREVLMANTLEGSDDRFNTEILEHDALYFVVRILIHDWQKVLGNSHLGAS
jgi:hypothetical protein